ncbi:cupin domain-containing protein [Nostoc sp. CENA67]|uniref:Cupin domain-containing protein n=1 Tax=Amazonocrinis nigriterrae CENA67 TaxID=2794033 RepID=A0A8J7HSH2_9NOST|nr:cupin domain-containing protein [Amazonocrinis nigriterrae]MBH8564652.1 cupin domain-containing protein [Amazonocrinis nigriterrae CENA67]
MKGNVFGLGIASSLLFTVAMNSQVQAHTFDDLPPIPDDLMEYIHLAEAGTLPDPLDPNKTQFWVAGGRNTYLKTGADTNGQYSLFDLYVPPNVGPPLHIHNREAEWFYVVDGNPSFQMDDEVIAGSTGSLLYGPQGHLHTFRNLTDTPVRMLLFYEPSGIENFFTEVGQPVTDPINPPSFLPEKLLVAGAKYGLEFPSTFVFASSQFSSDTGVTIIRTGDPSEAVGVTLQVGDITDILVNFGIGESLKTLDLSIPLGSPSLDLLLKSPTNGAYLGLLQNQATFNSATSVPEGSLTYGLLSLGALWLGFKLAHQQKSNSQNKSNSHIFNS